MFNRLLQCVQVILLTASMICSQAFFELPENADTYFVINLGRYILEHGIPHVDPFTIHENLQLVAQQWLSGVFFWELWENFGLNGLLATDMIFGAMMILIHWRLCLFVSGNKVLSFALSFVVGLIITPAIVPRPQLLSSLLLLIEVFLLEKFTRTNDAKFLLPLPLLSTLLVNLHAAVWTLSLVLCLPFLFVKNIRHVKLICAAMAGIFIGGLINPYGLDAMTYVMRSYGVSIISEHVAEMFSPTAHELRGKIFFLAEALIIFSFAKFKVPWRYVFLSGGIIFMALMHTRNEILFYLIATFPGAYIWRNLKPPKFLSEGGELLPTFFLLVMVNTMAIVTTLNDGLEKFSTPLEMLFFAATIFALYNLLVVRAEGRILNPKILPRKILSLAATGLIVSGIFFTTLKENHVDETFTAAIKFLLRSERPENISLYVNQGMGGMAGMLGVKYYIDSRSEVFLRANNGQKNILNEYVAFMTGKLNYREFFSRYDFTHIIISNNEPFIFDALSHDKNFRVIYESERVDGYNVVRCKIFTRKESRQ